ncbi:MAG: hypothetical protein JWN86_3348 [Planctomycetota bacterium]|nr:hypothetical protein [Planctomycetota bacterium]
MSDATLTLAPGPPPPTFLVGETIADLLARLGDVPASRVRLFPYPGTATEQDVIAIEAREKRLFELIDGTLVEKVMGFSESRCAAELIMDLGLYLRTNDIGLIAGADGMLRLKFRRVRIPDVSFIAWAHIPDPKVLDEPIPDLVPDLAVEILSEGNTAREMDEKLREYFSAGVRLVWYADPSSRTVRVFTLPEVWTDLGLDDTLDGGDVLPGFHLAIREWFERAERKGPRVEPA